MAKKAKGDKLRFVFHLLLRIAAVLFVLFCAVSIVSIQNSIVEKKRELAQIEEDIMVITAKNEELQDLISADDMGRYMEKIAVESNGYAYPNEWRYYDTSRN